MSSGGEREDEGTQTQGCLHFNKCHANLSTTKMEGGCVGGTVFWQCTILLFPFLGPQLLSPVSMTDFGH